MNLYNATPFAAAYSQGIQKRGRNCLVVVAKATYEIPEQAGKTPQPAQQQIEPFDSDSYTGEPGLSAPIYENDFATFKPRCDIILHASACSREPVTEKRVGFKVGDVEKQIRVIGPRHLEKGLIGTSPSEPEPFARQKISYDTAYGGSEPEKYQDDKTEKAEKRYTTFIRNPIGIGYHPNSSAEQRLGKPLPRSEEPDNPVTSLKSRSTIPQSFGPIARNWYPRHTLGGTYDRHWIDNIRPFLPEDFDERYYQCAPEEQQTGHLKGGEEVTLEGLTPQGETRFNLPRESIPMQAILSNGERHNLTPVIDTLIIEPDEARFTLVWRARIAIKRSIHEIDTLIVGKPTRGWERARMMNKLYLPLTRLNAFAKRRKKRLAEEERLRKLDEESNNSGNGGRA